MAFSTLSKNQSDILYQFFNEGIKYLIVGGYAVRHYGYKRSTTDLDILIENTKNSKEKLYKVLAFLGVPKENLGKLLSDQLKPTTKVKWHDVEIFLSMKGFDFDVFYDNRSIESIKGFEVSIISKQDLIKTKEDALIDSERTAKHCVDKDDLNKLTKFRV